MTVIRSQIRLSEALEPVSRVERVDGGKEYRLLGIRLQGAGPFLREIKFGSEISANFLHKVAKGDFIYSRLFAWRGAFGVIGDELDGCYVSNEFPIFRPKESSLDVKFLNYWFRLRPILKLVEADCSGSTPLTRNRYKEEYFVALEIPLPPLSEQKRIVAKIEELVAKMDEIQCLWQAVDKSILSFTLSLHKRLSGSQIVKIGELIELSEDRQEIKAENDYPQIGIRGFGCGLFPKAALRGSDTTYRYFNRLKAGQIVLSQVKGWEGAIAVCPPEMEGYYVSPEYRTFSCKRGDCDPAYMSFLVRTPWFHGILAGATRGQGARRERTRPELFLSASLPMPQIRAQQWAAGILNRLNHIPIYHAQTAAEFDTLLPSVLDKAYRGEL